MFRIFTFLFVVLFCSATFAVDDPEKFEAYQQRLKERRIYARNLMRATRHQRSVGTYNPFRTVYVPTPRVPVYYPYSRYVTPPAYYGRYYGGYYGYRGYGCRYGY